MKKIRGILIFLAALAIFGISAESFAKSRSIFSSALLKETYLGMGGLEKDWKGSGPEGAPTLNEAVILSEKLEVEILKTAYLASGGLESKWEGSGYEGAPNLFQATALLEQSKIEKLKREWLALGGLEKDWKGSFPDGSPILSEARAFIAPFITELKNKYLALGGSADAWTGSNDNPDTQYVETTPTLSEAQNLHNELVAEIARLKTDYLASGGEADAWTGTYDDDDPATQDVETTPTLSEAQALVQLLKKSKSSKVLIIGLTAGIGGALLLCGGLGYWFYRRRQKS